MSRQECPRHTIPISQCPTCYPDARPAPPRRNLQCVYLGEERQPVTVRCPRHRVRHCEIHGTTTLARCQGCADYETGEI